MAQYRQSGFERDRGGVRNGVASDHVSIGIRANPLKQSRHQHHHRRLKNRKLSIGALIVILSLAFVVSVSAFFYLSSKDQGSKDFHAQDDDSGNDTDFLTNVTRTQRFKVLKFGHGSVAHGRDSRYWDRDDRRRDEDYSEDMVEHASVDAHDGSIDSGHVSLKGKDDDKKSIIAESRKGLDIRGGGLYNEAGRDELKTYEAEYEASLKGVGHSRKEHSNTNQQSDDAHAETQNEGMDFDDEYDDGIYLHDARNEEYQDAVHDDGDHSDVVKSGIIDAKIKDRNIAEKVEGASSDLSGEDSSSNSVHSDEERVTHVSVIDGQSVRSTSERHSVSKKKSKRRKFSGSCEMKFLNSTAKLVEPLESRKFARFSLQYTNIQGRPVGQEQWEPRFAGHQSLKEREESFIAHDQKINCGFVKGPKGSQSTGFDLAEDDAKYISTCHIAVISCIFGNSDRLRTPMGKTKQLQNSIFAAISNLTLIDVDYIKNSGSCEMKFLNSTAKLVEPLESRKFARFSLQYTNIQGRPIGQEQWEPRFVGHQSLKEREESFTAHDQKINCGFVKGPKGSQSTGFDLAEDDAKYISTCHIAVISCIFGNSDRLRTPMGKTVLNIIYFRIFFMCINLGK
ncbi:unnamed protein product [Ilex paraguariensis]|uniref:TOD1/MUCI70 glycosyltransferase-like domain-containing protein n=1 Tax=Ilex paraguariensis TaxID=185542 RepID=A0ABC8SKA2_9AQUA